jgi:hypothetical protein
MTYPAIQQRRSCTSPIQLKVQPPHLDLVGPLPMSASCHTHLFTILDRSTRWAEAIPLQSTLAESCAAAMIVGQIACFGVHHQEKEWMLCEHLLICVYSDVSTK